MNRRDRATLLRHAREWRRLAEHSDPGESRGLIMCANAIERVAFETPDGLHEIASSVARKVRLWLAR